MSSFNATLALRPGVAQGAYPERRDGRPPALLRALRAVVGGVSVPRRASRTRIAAFVRSEPTSESFDIRSLLDETGSIEYAFNVARRYVDTAADRLRALPDTPARDSLQSMAEFILRRQF